MHPTNRRAGFTLVELLVVIGIMLLLAAMTIGAINLSVTSERTRGAARQVQSLLEGARDRAIYAGQPRGVRILVNEQITEPIGGGRDVSTLATTLVYIGSPGEDTSEPDYDDADHLDADGIPDGDGDTSELFKYINVVDPAQFPNRSPSNSNEVLAQKAIIGVNTRWSTLHEQGLIGPGTVIRISPDGVEEARRSDEFFTIDPRSFPVRDERFWFGGSGGITVFPNPGGSGSVNRGAAFADDVDDDGTLEQGTDEVLFLTYESQQVKDQMIGFTPGSPNIISTDRWSYVMETNPDVLPGEDPSILPRNTCIDLEMSHLPEGWLTRVADPSTTSGFRRQFSNRMDLLFSPNGAIIGSEGAAGLIHLRVCDIGDAIANTLPGSPTLPGSTEPREGDEFGVTIFTRSGRVNVHPLDVRDSAAYPDEWAPSTAYATGETASPPIYNGLIYRCVTAGTSDNVVPEWNLNPGGLTQDASVVWRGEKHNVWIFGVEGELAR